MRSYVHAMPGPRLTVCSAHGGSICDAPKLTPSSAANPILLFPERNRANHALYIYSRRVLSPWPHHMSKQRRLLLSDFAEPSGTRSRAAKKKKRTRGAEGIKLVTGAMMAAEWWWFLVVNAVVAAIAVLSSRARPPLASSSPRRGAGEITRRASSAVLQRLRSFSIFSFPSTSLPFLQPDATAAAVSSETEEPVTSPIKSPPPALAGEEEEEGDPNAMNMEQAYALAVARRRRPEPEVEEEARRSDVDAKAEEFIRGFKEDLRQQRLNSIFNYTQMLKQRAVGDGRGQPAARPDQL